MGCLRHPRLSCLCPNSAEPNPDGKRCDPALEQESIENIKQFKLIFIFILLVICGLFLITGCTKVKQARKAPKSGFLGDYSELKEVGGDKAMLAYVNPDYFHPQSSIERINLNGQVTNSA